MGHALRTGLEDRIVEHETGDLGDVLANLPEPFVQQIDAIGGQVVLHPAGPNVGIVHP